MKKDDFVYAGHMLDTARALVGKIAGIDRDTFDMVENLRLAVTHLIQIIGEASGRVSNEFRSLHQEIPWQEIVGMRHKIVHDYLHVNFDVVWGVATHDVPILIEKLARFVPDP